MFKNSKPYLLATILIGMGLANLFRSLDAVHHTINLLGITLLLYSLLFKKWSQFKKYPFAPLNVRCFQMLIFDVPVVKLLLIIVAEMMLYLIAYLCNRKNKDIYIRLFKVSVLMTILLYISSRI